MSDSRGTMHEPQLFPLWELRETSKGFFIFAGSQCLCRVTARHNEHLRLLLAAPRMWNALTQLSVRYDLPDDVRLAIQDTLQRIKLS